MSFLQYFIFRFFKILFLVTFFNFDLTKTGKINAMFFLIKVMIQYLLITVNTSEIKQFFTLKPKIAYLQKNIPEN